jgi:hypothetical protein
MMDEKELPEDLDEDEQPEEVIKLTEGVQTLDISKEVASELRALDGAVVEDEFSEDAMNYEILLEKLDALLEKLNLEA